MKQGAKGGGRLVVCPTPLGNLEDVTLRVLRELAEADIIACEDTRRTRKLLARHGIKAKLTSYHEHNERRRLAELVERIAQGQRVALVSDAGTPAISDPGQILVGACIKRGLPLEVLPGPSAVTTAVVAAGVKEPKWRFVGFLPKRAPELKKVLAEAGGDATVAFESPQRLVRTLKVIAELDGDRELSVCRELTKVHEEVVRGAAQDVHRHFKDATTVKGEVVIVLGGVGLRKAAAVDMGRLVEAVGQLAEAGARPRAAAKVVASLAGEGRRANSLYRAYLQRK